MKTLITTIIAGCLCACAHSQVIIYKNSLTRVTTGAGLTTKTKITGYTILNPTNAAVTRIEAYPTTRDFRVWDITYSVSTVRGASAKQFLVFSEVDSFLDSNDNDYLDSETMKGQLMSVNIGAVPATWSIPKTMPLIGRTTYSFNSGDPAIDETSGNVVYDAKDTLFANANAFTYEDAIAALKSLLTNAGYTEL